VREREEEMEGCRGGAGSEVEAEVGAEVVACKWERGEAVEEAEG
jgi:hypothetical protein